jgi:hypothetical protein
MSGIALSRSCDSRLRHSVAALGETLKARSSVARETSARDDPSRGFQPAWHLGCILGRKLATSWSFERASYSEAARWRTVDHVMSRFCASTFLKYFGPAQLQLLPDSCREPSAETQSRRAQPSRY